MINKLFQLINKPNTYVGDAPVQVNECQWIKIAGGVPHLHFGKDIFDKPAYSVYVRGMNNNETLNRTQEVFQTVRDFTQVSSQLIATRLPSYVGKDDKDRNIYVFQLEYQSGG